MPNRFPQELRQRAVRAYENREGSFAALAERFEISEDSLFRWAQRFREMGSLLPFKKGGGWKSKVDVELLHEVIAANRDSTSTELPREYNRHVEDDMAVSRSAFLRAAYQEQYVFKKTAARSGARPAR